MYACAHTPLDEETIKLTGFSSGDKLYTFIRGFYGLKGLPNFFTKQMSTFFRSLIDKRSALVYIDDILLLADEKQETLELIKELHKIATKENLKLAPFSSLLPKRTNHLPFIQQYNPPSGNDDNDNNDSNINDPIKSFDSFSDEEQSVEDEDHTFTSSNEETDIPSTTDF